MLKWNPSMQGAKGRLTWGEELFVGWRLSPKAGLNWLVSLPGWTPGELCYHSHGVVVGGCPGAGPWVARAKACWAQTCLVCCGPHKPPCRNWIRPPSKRAWSQADLVLLVQKQQARPTAQTGPVLLQTPSGADRSSPSLKESRRQRSWRCILFSYNPSKMSLKQILI